MAITFNDTPKESGEERLTVEFTNGELRVIKSIVEGWRFRDAKSFLDFALAVFSKKNVRFTVRGTEDENPTRVEPADELLLGKEEILSNGEATKK